MRCGRGQGEPYDLPVRVGCLYVSGIGSAGSTHHQPHTRAHTRAHTQPVIRSFAPGHTRSHTNPHAFAFAPVGLDISRAVLSRGPPTDHCNRRANRADRGCRSCNHRRPCCCCCCRCRQGCPHPQASNLLPSFLAFTQPRNLLPPRSCIHRQLPFPPSPSTRIRVDWRACYKDPFNRRSATVCLCLFPPH